MADIYERRYTELEAMKLLGFTSRTTMYNERKAGRLGYYRFGHNVEYGESHLKNYLASCERNTKKS